MGKFGRNKFKALNKITKSLRYNTSITENKVLKKKANAEKRVTFQKEVLLKEAVSSPNSLVKNVSSKVTLSAELSKKYAKKETAEKSARNTVGKTKVKHVEKHTKRQKTQISDAKMLLNLMKKVGK